jgi:hypothetical protein
MPTHPFTRKEGQPGRCGLDGSLDALVSISHRIGHLFDSLLARLAMRDPLPSGNGFESHRKLPIDDDTALIAERVRETLE